MDQDPQPRRRSGPANDPLDAERLEENPDTPTITTTILTARRGLRTTMRALLYPRTLLHFEAGLHIILDYLNDANSFTDLCVITGRAKAWCREYCHRMGAFPRGSPKDVWELHPYLLYFDIPSWFRLDKSAPELPRPWTLRRIEEDFHPQDFPSLAARTVLDERSLKTLCESHAYDIQRPDDAYAEYRIPFVPADLQDSQSPILYHIPQVVDEIAQIDSEILSFKRPLRKLDPPFQETMAKLRPPSDLGSNT
ncbi:hypothetical protein G7Z17_g7809 [Cylindrodendrum hubeiense]|uniref:Uncharacterized protein n=1 Tax=Cylindrodendrum hubeiense TaxID=595255 RepID=A0A9P5H777_9HYPO|nr:hypothetical protein G7Z17_g7809 [Cylindrodendrum hubeiense]